MLVLMCVCVCVCFHASCVVTTVMDITEIAHGNADDEEKQHFIPFQQ